MLRGMKKHFDHERTLEAKREPITWEMVKTMYQERHRNKGGDEGVAIGIAYAGLYRMGELTSTTKRPFDASKDLSEKHVLFKPSFWNATTVQIQIGTSKADKDGRKDALRPRVLTVTDNDPGTWLRDMLARRWNLPKGMEPSPTSMPLFQSANGNHLTQDKVLLYMRRTLAKMGYTKAQQQKYGTHSCRIGGATRLFQIGASMEVVQELGGWSSDARKLYVRMQRDHLIKFSLEMCRA